MTKLIHCHKENADSTLFTAGLYDAKSRINYFCANNNL